MKKLLFMVFFSLFSIFSFLFAQPGIGPYLQEFGNPSPGWQKEQLQVSVYRNGYIYAATQFNGHIYKINPATDTIADLGSVAADSIHSNKGCFSLISDGKYIYGSMGASVPFLFYIDSTDNIHYFSTPGLIGAHGDAVLYKNGLNTYVFFGGDDPAGLKLIKWHVSGGFSGSGSAPLRDVSIISLTSEQVGTRHIELGTKNNRAVVYVGGLNNRIYTYDIGYNSVTGTCNVDSLGDVVGRTYEVKNFKADINQGYVWLFGSAQYSNALRLNLNTSSIDTVIPIDSIWGTARWEGNVRYFASDDTCIYTHVGKLNMITKTFTQYNLGSVNEMFGFSILKNGNYLYSVDGTGNYTKKLYTYSLANNTMTSSDLPEPSPSGPVGGGEITALSVENDSVYAPLYYSGLELFYNSTTGSTTPLNLPKGAQSDCVVYDSLRGATIYGLYAGPFLRIRRATSDITIQLMGLPNLDSSQIRITDMAFNRPNGDTLFIATGPSANQSAHSNAHLLLFNLAAFYNNPGLNGSDYCKVIGRTDAGLYLNDIECYTIHGTTRDTIYVYGCADWKNRFVYKLPATITSVQTIPTINDSQYVTTMLINGNELMTNFGAYLAIFDVRLLKSSSHFYYSDTTAKIVSVDGFFHPTSQEERSGAYRLTKGNDGLFYGFYNGTLFRFNRNNLGIHWHPNVGRYTVPGYDTLLVPNYSIGNISRDYKNFANKKMYVGANNGRLYRLESGAIIDTNITHNKMNLDNYPNPFNPTTTIRYSVPDNGHVTLKVYSILGEEVATLVNSEQLKGTYDAQFNGSRLASGVYFYRLETNNQSIVKKMLLLK